jgi:hypothetical protein
MHDPTTSLETETETAPRGFEPLHLSWWILSSPLTFAALSSLLALLLLLGMGVEQGAGLKGLLSAHAFSTVRAIQGFGIDRVLTGWTTQLVALLLCLNTLGLFLRYGRQPGALPGAIRVTGELPVSIEALAEKAPGLIGGRDLQWGMNRRRVQFQHGFAREAMWLVLVGLLTLLLALIVWDRLALDARLTVIPGEAGGQARMLVQEGDHWVERQLPMALSCERADPADGQRRRRCQARTSEWEGHFVVGAGREDRIAGYRISALDESPRMGLSDEDIVLLIRRGEASSRAQLKGQSGQHYRLSAGEELSLFSGLHGPLVVVKTTDGNTTLMAPRLTMDDIEGVAPFALEAVPAWSVRMAMQGEPHRYLMWSGLLLLLVGLLLLCRPEATVRFVATETGTEVRIDAIHHSKLPSKLLTSLERGFGGDV